jgi:hypothetical protein
MPGEDPRSLGFDLERAFWEKEDSTDYVEEFARELRSV